MEELHLLCYELEMVSKAQHYAEELEKLKPKINNLEVALSIASGSGKEHMALMSALINLPVGVRFTALTKDGVVYL